MNAVLDALTQTPAALGVTPHLGTAVLSTGLGAGSVGSIWGLWTWLGERAKARATAPAAMTASLVSFQATLNDQARALITELRTELADVKQRVDELETENVRCQGENRQALQRIDSLESLLSRHGIPIPGKTPPGSFVVIEADRTTILSPSSAPAP